MEYIREWVLHGAAERQIGVRELDEAERTRLLDDVFAKYTRGYRYSWAMWESKFFAEHVGLRAEDGWRWCGDLVGSQEVVLFFNSSDDKAMFMVAGGDDLVNILGEMPRREFYLTNASTDYLLCFNHHDYLIACGATREWMVNYQLSAVDGDPSAPSGPLG